MISHRKDQVRFEKQILRYGSVSAAEHSLVVVDVPHVFLVGKGSVEKASQGDEVG